MPYTRAGQAVARNLGKRWGGSKKGRRLKVTAEQVHVIQRLRAEGVEVAAIGRATGLSRPTIYSVIGLWRHRAAASTAVSSD